MGNGIGKISHCCSISGDISTRHVDLNLNLNLDVIIDEGFGHSFCYIRPETLVSPTSSFQASEDFLINPSTSTTFRSISGAYVSANTFTPLSTTLYDDFTNPENSSDRAARFESSTSFASSPLQPVPRNTGFSGPTKRGFMSGPIERAFMSGPIDRSVFSGPIINHVKKFDGNVSFKVERKQRKKNLMSLIRKGVYDAMNRRRKKAAVMPKEATESEKVSGELTSVDEFSSDASLVGGNENVSGDFSMGSRNLEWAEGKAGEDRVHVVVSDEHGWVFVGIYDGFNGPDAPDYLLSNLYSAVHEELKGLLWSEIESTFDGVESDEMGNKWEESQRRWKCEWDRERYELDKEDFKLKVLNGDVAVADPSDVLKALSEALRKTEEAYLDTADKMVVENPELALMGSCVLVMLMKGEDVYLMNVGDSRAVLARRVDPKIKRNLGWINEEGLGQRRSSNADELCGLKNLASVQLTMDHSTNVKEVH